jgi:hypothetical protein
VHPGWGYGTTRIVVPSRVEGSESALADGPRDLFSTGVFHHGRAQLRLRRAGLRRFGV